MDALAPKATVWRHVYTWSRGARLGLPGFQTVAAAAELGEDRIRALERLVGGARPPEPEGGRPSLLLQPLPTDRGRSVASRVVPTGRGPDGRPGNFWAESLVVPDAWFEAADWDLPAAFERLEWWGPRDLDGGGPGEVRWLQSEGLAPAPPGRADRLARLPELVPDGDVRRALLETVAWQAEGGGRDGTLHVVAAPETTPEDLEALVLLLPLALPVRQRVRRRRGVEGERRCLRLATLATPGSLERPDLVGVPFTHLDAARGEPGMVADLAGGIPPPAPGGNETRRWARRVDEALLDGRWHEALAAEREGDPGERPRRAPRAHETPAAPAGLGAEGERMNEEPNETSEPEVPRDPVEHRGSVEDPFAQRAAAWSLREESEAGAAELVERFRADARQLLEPLKQLVESERRKLREEVQSLVEQARGEIEDEVDRGRRQILDAVTVHKGAVRKQLEHGLAELDEHEKEVLRRLQGQETRAQEHLALVASAALDGSVESREEDREPDGPPPERPRPAATAAKSSSSRASGSGSVTPWHVRLRAAVQGWPAPFKWGGLALFLVLLAAVVYFAFVRPPAEEEPADGKTATRAAGEPVTEIGPETPDPDRTRAIERLRSGATAATMLQAAVAHPPLADHAAAGYLALRLASEPGLDETTSCALLQQVLSDRLQERGAPPIAVDGRCGQGTVASVEVAAADLACGATEWPGQAACLLNRRFSEGEPPCAAVWPFRRPCPWRPAEARRVLDTLGRASVLQRSTYDLAANPELASRVADRQLTEAEAGALLPLAYGTAVARSGAAPPARLPSPAELGEDEIEAVLRLLDRLPSVAGAP